VAGKIPFWGQSIFFFLLGLALHLTSVRLLFEIISRLTAKESLAAFGASLWGLSPYAVGTLGWISVHGQAYATAAILWVLLDVVRYSQTPSLFNNRLLVRHVILLLLAATSFGTGLASALAFALVAALLNPNPNIRPRIIGLYGFVAVAIIALYVSTMSNQSDPVASNQGDLALLMRKFHYAEAIMESFTRLLSTGSSVLLGGPLIVGKISIVPRDSLPFVATSIATFITAPLVILGCFLSRPKERRVIFALLILSFAAYGMIAMARTGPFLKIPMISSRYHYLPMAMMAVMLCLILSPLIDRLPGRALEHGRASFFIWLALVIIPYSLGPMPTGKESNILMQNKQYKESMETLTAALEDNAAREDIYIANKPFVVYLRRTSKHFPGLAALFVMTYPSNTVDGKRVFFLEESRELVEMAQAQKGSRISELLIYAPKESE
jgi:hypothetical protein